MMKNQNNPEKQYGGTDFSTLHEKSASKGREKHEEGTQRTEKHAAISLFRRRPMR